MKFTASQIQYISKQNGSIMYKNFKTIFHSHFHRFNLILGYFLIDLISRIYYKILKGRFQASKGGYIDSNFSEQFLMSMFRVVQ